MNYYIIFPNVNEAMHLDKRLTEAAINHIVTPTPRNFSNSCGICIRYNSDDYEKIKEIVLLNDIKVKDWCELPDRR